MPVPLLCSALLGAVLLTGQPGAPAVWSPDGQWLLYLLATRSPAAVLSSDWLFATHPAAPDPGIGPGAGRTYRLWATRPAGGESVLLEESAGPLTSADWNPDGSALAFGRMVLARPGHAARFEVVIQDDIERKRVVHTRDLGAADPVALEALGGARVAWSPDGKYLAVPMAAPTGLAFLRAETGHLIKAVEGAFAASWSPDGGKVAFYGAGEPAGLYWMDANFGDPRRLGDAPAAERLPAPDWARSGQAVRFVRVARDEPVPGRPRGLRVDLVQVALNGEPVQLIQDLALQPIEAEAHLRSASYCFDENGENLLFLLNADEQVAQVTWVAPSHHAVRVRFNPVDEAVPLGPLSLPPGGRRLALRIGGRGPTAPVALCDPETQALVPLVPDEAARVEWLAFLVGAVRSVLTDPVRVTALGGKPAGPDERATLLPPPPDLDSQDPVALRLRRLARIGRPLCDLRPNAPPPDEALTAALGQARLAFSYLKLDDHGANYRAALAALGPVEARTTDPDRRFRLACLRIQIDLGLGERDRARAALSYLRDFRLAPTERIEETGSGLVVSPVSHPGEGWLASLERALERPASPSKGPSPAAEFPPGIELPLQAAPAPKERVDAVPVFPGAAPF